jgi:hypothetical protein
VLPPHLAAYFGAGAEICLPVVLALGIGTRFSAIALFIFNIVAVISYPDLSDAGLKDHVLWGALLLVTLVYGPGKFALDRWFERRDPQDKQNDVMSAGRSHSPFRHDAEARFWRVRCQTLSTRRGVPRRLPASRDRGRDKRPHPPDE